MCKPGSARGGSGGISGAASLAMAVLAAAAVVSMAAAFITDILTVVLIAVFTVAAAGIILLAILLCRTRGVVTWPMRSPLAAPGQRPAPARDRVLPARRAAWPVADGAAWPSVPARQPQAVEAVAPAFVRIGGPAGSSDLVLMRQPAYPPEQMPAAVRAAQPAVPS